MLEDKQQVLREIENLKNQMTNLIQELEDTAEDLLRLESRHEALNEAVVLFGRKISTEYRPPRGLHATSTSLHHLRTLLHTSTGLPWSVLVWRSKVTEALRGSESSRR